jgi:hypothetical protein
MLVLLLVVIVCLFIDILGIRKNKNKFGTALYQVEMKTKKRFRFVLIFIFIITIFEFVNYFIAADIHLLPLCFMALAASVMFWIHNIVRNGINENGIMYWGGFHGWQDIKSYKIENDKILELDVIGKVFGIKYNNKVQLCINFNDKEDIEKLLVEKTLEKFE